MLIEHLEDYYRKQGEDRRPPNPWRASDMGHCIRAGCYAELGLKGRPLQPRRMAVFKHGTMIHDCLTDDLSTALGWRFISEHQWYNSGGKDYVEIDGAKISFHIDGAFQHEGGIGITEFKSMSEYAFKRAQEGIIDHEYLCQAWVYFKGTDFNPVVFIPYRKNTSAMVEVIFDRHCNEKVVTQRLTGDPVQIARDDPILLTEIRSPFDESVEEYVRERIRWLKHIKSRIGTRTIEALTVECQADVPGADAVVDEVEKVQGKEKLGLLGDWIKDQEMTRSGSWYTFKTGRKILGFPCSYCAFMDQCYKTELEMKGDKPVFVVK